MLVEASATCGEPWQSAQEAASTTPVDAARPWRLARYAFVSSSWQPEQSTGFSAGAISNKGARGLMQLMPATAARFGVTNPHNPAQSIMAGARYLKFLLDLFEGRVDLALAGYNAGEGAVQKYGNRVPPYAETRNYVQSIGSRYAEGGGVKLVNKTYVKKS